VTGDTTAEGSVHFDQPMGDDTWKFLEHHFSRAYLEELKGLARYLAGRKAGQFDPSGLVIEAVLKAARNRSQLKDPAKFNPWMKTILVREVMAGLQLECHRRTQEMSEDYLRTLSDRGGRVSPLEREDQQSWAKAYLWRLLSLLSEADREVICLCRMEGLPDPEAAELLGISQQTLRKRRSRALQRLQQLAQ
jgi:RNA polymerase sigma factor (sigma-70 family)